jgi:hypothetical protein
MDEINLAQYSSAFQRLLAIFAFHHMSESANLPNSLWLLIKTAFFAFLTVDLGGRQSRSAGFSAHNYRNSRTSPSLRQSNHTARSEWPVSSLPYDTAFPLSRRKIVTSRAVGGIG